ncbi:MAG TPA: N-6 DNA methylase [Blastocatellia bacterium]|nr:N-6 DNA methylase [Blastocatellia bacterium]
MQVSSASVKDHHTEKRHKFGQFLTPRPVADLMASMFDIDSGDVELLDAGAGTGALTSAFVRRLCAERQKPKRLSVTAYELDPSLIDPLRLTMSECKKECERAGISFSATLLNEDFISAAAPVARGDLFSTELPSFSAAIVNPPYRKIRSSSAARLWLRSAGIETSNLYTGFVALIIKLLAAKGQLVAITPRSFCNGPYFKPFRADFLDSLSLRRVHVFESRSAAFNDDNVLQENIIIHAVKGNAEPKDVIISTSSGKPHGAIIKSHVPYRDVVSPNDPNQFIHLIVDETHRNAKSVITRLSATLDDIGLSVSTGRVVDFRARSFLRRQPDANTVPLIYPCHFGGGFVNWPKANSRKPNAILCDEMTQELLVPSGVYVLVKRFTAKEERRRVVACIYDPDKLAATSVGFENHLNYFHLNGSGLSMNLAKGLAAFLNSTVVDVYFRQFSGHTQVNATDLRALKYPSRAELERLGARIDDPARDQNEIDEIVKD